MYKTTVSSLLNRFSQCSIVRSISVFWRLSDHKHFIWGWGWRAEWGGDTFYSHGSKHSRGVMILIRPTLKAENISITNDKNGRLLIVRLILQDEEFCLANIYAPNDQKQQIQFYSELLSKLRPHANENVLVGGDFNCPLENIDKIG